jgi:tryptophan synthase alpha chain
LARQSGEIQKAFHAARGEGRAALVIYTTAGHPTMAEGLEALLTLADAGADVIELGVPFSDPLADGPTIQKSSFDAIEEGVDLPWCLDLLRQFREERSTPIVLFSYLNPIMDYGIERFLADAVAAGADGLLLTDLPVDADPALESLIEGSPLDLVRLIAPTTTPARAKLIAARSQGFAYYISRTGVTGTGVSLSTGLSTEVTALRAVAQLPVAVGFGISNPEQAASVAAVADGVIVGSAVVAALSSGGVAAAGELVRSMRDAIGAVAVVG